MKLQEKERIYDRLSNISLSIESQNIPNIAYINEKIWKCHILIEEVEKFYISINREISVIQRSLNNAMASYESSRDTLISTDMEIKSLPSQKDREAHANMKLKDELNEIKKLKNECVDLENLQKVINLKFKNLTRLNGDIKIQLKLMDSQMRLGQGDINNSATKSLMEEMGKSRINEDVFKDVDTSVEEQSIIDPTSPIDMDELFGNVINDEPIQESKKEFNEYLLNGLFCPECGEEQREVPSGYCCAKGHGGLEGIEKVGEMKLVNDVNIIDSTKTEINDEPIQEETDLLPIYPDDDLSSCMQNPPVPDENSNVITEEILAQGVIDLDEVFGYKTPDTTILNKEEPKTEKSPTQEPEMDLDSLLSQFN